ncbi:hypothetical protein R2601_03578 [Salipiger bermudensis HTCC2601]|uniref:Uncharacterized protein n=1 Tax=Salipiger bermudensis (strain DSM 26914 / JCM 13377 / KCTC 12554 / HTCC2601) TaxID=314265 RepID=Q0FWD0_SALBH|nr:hypothetical protein R2601_03578 [Salipiger bermudensis HTCC2601]
MKSHSHASARPWSVGVPASGSVMRCPPLAPPAPCLR